jgi:hypothetical protein
MKNRAHRTTIDGRYQGRKLLVAGLSGSAALAISMRALVNRCGVLRNRFDRDRVVVEQRQAVRAPRPAAPGWLQRTVHAGLATQHRPTHIPADPQDIMAALPGTPSDDEIAERLIRKPDGSESAEAHRSLGRDFKPLA